ncbi:hypothetical protein Q3G72_013832 [Acer saccharum]|nr:hypothetical protein Q3G72_013832 [Acer saccharum]
MVVWYHSPPLSNHFVLLYSKCGCLTAAHHVFNQTQYPNVFSFNVLISAYAKESRLNIAHQLVDQIPQPVSVSYNTLISAYAVFGETLIWGLTIINIFVVSSSGVSPSSEKPELLEVLIKHSLLLLIPVLRQLMFHYCPVQRLLKECNPIKQT